MKLNKMKFEIDKKTDTCTWTRYFLTVTDWTTIRFFVFNDVSEKTRQTEKRMKEKETRKKNKNE